ncbi:hypothetical protein BST61_g8365 [Cercospora zeina]
MAANHAPNKGLPSAYGANTQYNPPAGTMSDIATITTVNTVSMWPATTIGTQVSYEPLATNCFVVGMTTSCLPNPPADGAAAAIPPPSPESTTPAVIPVETTTATAVLTLTSRPLRSTETTRPSTTTNSANPKTTSTSSTNTSSTAPTQTNPLLPGLTGTANESDSGARSRQIGVAIGISLALLLIALLIWLVFAWKKKRYPFRKRDDSNEEAELVMEKIDRTKDAHLTGGAAIFPRRKSSRPKSHMSSIRNRPTSSRYSQDLNTATEKKHEVPYEAWTDTMSNASRQQPQGTRDFIDGKGSGLEDDRRPFSGTSFSSLYDPMPPTPPPTSPLPPIPLAAALHMPSTERRSMVYRKNFPDSPVLFARESGVVSPGPYQSGLHKNDDTESHWSLQRMGSPSPVSEPNDDEMQIPGNPYDRVTGLEYLYSMPKQRSGERE